MIIFYNKTTGNIFATIDGRMHTTAVIDCMITDSSVNEKDVDKIVIGFEKLDGGKTKEHNMDMFDMVQKFENDKRPEHPLKYKVDKNKLVRQT